MHPTHRAATPFHLSYLLQSLLLQLRKKPQANIFNVSNLTYFNPYINILSHAGSVNELFLLLDILQKARILTVSLTPTKEIYVGPLRLEKTLLRNEYCVS